MSKIYWGFYLHVSGMKLGSSAEVGIGAGSVSVTGPDYNWGRAGAGGCYFAINLNNVKKIYPVQFDFISLQGQGLITPAQPQEDEIDLTKVTLPSSGAAKLLTNSRLEIQVHQYRCQGNGWKDVPINIKLTSPRGINSSKTTTTLLSRDGVYSLKGFADTATIIRGTLQPPSNQVELMKRWNSCFGRN